MKGMKKENAKMLMKCVLLFSENSCMGRSKPLLCRWLWEFVLSRGTL